MACFNFKIDKVHCFKAVLLALEAEENPEKLSNYTLILGSLFEDLCQDLSRAIDKITKLEEILKQNDIKYE